MSPDISDHFRKTIDVAKSRPISEIQSQIMAKLQAASGGFFFTRAQEKVRILSVRAEARTLLNPLFPPTTQRDPGRHPECCPPRGLGKQHSASCPQGGGQLPPSSFGPAGMRAPSPYPQTSSPVCRCRHLAAFPDHAHHHPWDKEPRPIGPHKECLWR